MRVRSQRGLRRSAGLLLAAAAALALGASVEADQGGTPQAGVPVVVAGARPPAGQLVGPSDLAASPDGTVYVMDEGAGRIQRFTGGGTFLGLWGAPGRGEGEFGLPAGDALPAWAPSADVAPPCGGPSVEAEAPIDPRAAARRLAEEGVRSSVAVGPTGVVFVADAPNVRIQKFTADGLFYTQWRAAASTMALAPDGTLYATDPLDGKVRRYCPAGRPMGAWGADGESGRCSRVRAHPSPIAVTPDFQVIVAHRERGRVEVCSGNGDLLDAFDLPEAQWSGDMALASDGALVFTGVGRDGFLRTSLSGEPLAGFGARGAAEGQVPGGSRVAALEDGLLVLTPTGEVRRFDAGGAQRGVWGARGSGIGQLSRPSGAAVDADGSVLVVDAGNHRLQRFVPGAGVVSTWGEAGSAPGRLLNPTDVAVGPEGPVIVSDTGNARIGVFTADGAPISQWSATDTGALVRPLGLDVGADGVVYVADAAIDRVARFDARGRPLPSLGGQGAGALDEPHDVAVAPDGTVYVADRGNRRIAVFAADGTYRDAWTDPTPSDAHAFEPVSVAVGEGGRLWVADAATGGAFALDDAGRLEQPWDGGGAPLQGAEGGAGAVAFGAGFLVVVDGSADRVHRAVDAATVEEWGTAASDLGRFDDPVDVAAGPDGGVLVLDAALDRVQALDGRGRPTHQWSAAGGPAAGDVPVALAGGGAYVVRSDGRVLRFDGNGRLRGAWRPDGAHEARGPAAAAMAPDGSLGVAFGGSDRLAVFGADLVLDAIGGGTGSAAGQLRRPLGIAPIADGFLVADTGNDRLQAFSRTGAFLGGWPAAGLSAPEGLASSGDRAYVADAGNDRVRVFDLEGRSQGEIAYPRPRRLALADERLWVLGGPEDPVAERVGETGGNAARLAAFGGPGEPAWRGEVFANEWLTGPAAAVLASAEADFSWGDRPLAPGLAGRTASARFIRSAPLEAGRHAYRLEAEGGVRLWLGDELVVDEWTGPGTLATGEVRGEDARAVRVEFRDLGRASLHLTFRREPLAHAAYLPSLAGGGG